MSDSKTELDTFAKLVKDAEEDDLNPAARDIYNELKAKGIVDLSGVLNLDYGRGRRDMTAVEEKDCP